MLFFAPILNSFALVISLQFNITGCIQEGRLLIYKCFWEVEFKTGWKILQFKETGQN